MKKFVLFAAGLAAAATGFAQQAEKFTTLDGLAPVYGLETANAAAKTTGFSDTGYLAPAAFIKRTAASNFYTQQVFDTSYRSPLDRVSPYDSGFYYGTSPLLNRGFAEQFYFYYKSDTTLRLLGFRTIFGGHLQSTSTKQLTFGVWGKAAPTLVRTKFYNEGLPGTSRGTVTVNANKIGAGGTGTTGADTFKNVYLSAPISMIAADSEFYVGYTMPAYSWNSASLAGDTFGMRSTRPSYGILSTGYYGSGTAPDTFLYNKSVYLDNGGNWNDSWYNYGLVRNLSIVPIVQLSGSKIQGVGGVVKNNLTFFGSFPNPATTSTTVRFALKNTVDVTLELSDYNGRVIRRDTYSKLSAGQHDLNLSVDNLAAGNYVYMVSTSEGDAMASQLTVIK